MPRYTFTGAYETVLEGLVHGVNAVLHRRDDDGEDVDHGQPEESTVVVRTGDQVVTDEPYPHADMVNVETEKPDTPPTLAEALKRVEQAGQDGTSALDVLKAAGAGAEDNSAQVQQTTDALQQHPGTGGQMTAVEHPADGTMSPPVSNDPPADPGQTTDTDKGQE